MDTKWNGTDRDPGENLEDYVTYQISGALDGGADAPGVIRVEPGKHPRLRAWTGLMALLLGFALAAGGLCSALGQWVMRGSGEAWELDWQETKAFQSTISGYVRDFLTLGAGGTLEWYDTVLESDTIWGSDGTDTAASSDMAAEETGDTAPDAAYQADKNMLYGIRRDSRLRYTNTGDLLDDAADLPEGYNFLLIFKDGRARAWKDGTEIDLYGDGVYTEDSGWYLPGYENFTAGEGVEDVEVRLAVREIPILYLQGRYDSGYVSESSPLYDLYQELREIRSVYLGTALAIAAGVALLVLARRLREDRKRAEAAVAAKTAYIWTELRFLAAAACLLGMMGTGRLWDYYHAVRYDLYRVGAGQWPDLVTAGLSYGIGMVLANLPAALALCLLLWLIRNDHRYNPREQRRGCLRSLNRVLRDRTLRLPVQKRLRRWALAPVVGMVLCAAAGFAVLLVCMSWYWDAYRTFVALTILGFVLVLTICALSARHQLALARDIGRLADRTAAIRSGDLDAASDLPRDGDLHQIAEDLDHIQAGLQQALADRTRSERMKVELIANVSHDLKTPLTSILSYAELLRQEPLEGAAADYARIIDQKAQRLKAMVQDVFEVSKAASNQLPVDLERLDLAKLLWQTLADMADPIEQSGLTLRTDLPEGEVPVVADGKRLYRVFQNLIQNALQYSLPGTRIYLTLKAEQGRAEASLRNTSRQELPAGVDFTARFVRGDASRTDGGSGLGLSIARSFTEACGGTLAVETVADLFTVRVSFPLAPER